MNRWKHKLQLGDIFHNEDMPFEQRRDEIVRRIKASPWWDEDDYRLHAAVDLISESDSVGEFDGYWDEFYDWADDESVWIETFKVVSA